MSKIISIKNPQTPKGEQSRQRILAAASELFLHSGVQALSARAIAAHAGVSTMGIYSHFNGKQGILDALYIEGFELVSKTMEVDRGQTAIAQLMQAGDQYLELGEKFEAHYRLIFGEADNGYTPREEAAEIRLASFKKLVEVSSDLLRFSHRERVSDAQHSNDDKLQFALEIWALLHGFVSLKHHTLDTQSFAVGDSGGLNWNWKDSARQALLRLASSYKIA